MLIHFLATFAAILIGAYIVPGVEVTLTSALVVAVLLGIINLFFKPIIRVLTLPINILTLGLFSLVVNGLIILGLAAVVPNFAISGFWIAVLYAVLVSIISAFFALILDND